MKIQCLTAAAVVASLSMGGAALAQAQTGAMASPMGSTMAKDHMQMSKADMKAVEACKKMDAAKMAKSAKCQKLNKMHPDAMMASPMGAMSTGAMSTGAMGKTAH
jgi:hypothetical protein